MILAAALTLAFLAILCLIPLAHFLLFLLAPPASARAADKFAEIQRTAGELWSAVISQAKSGFAEFGQQCSFRIEVAAFVRIDGRLVAVRAILEKPQGDDAAPLPGVDSAPNQHREFSKVAEYPDVHQRPDTIHTNPIDRLV